MTPSDLSIDTAPSSWARWRGKIAAWILADVHPLDRGGSGACRRIVAVYLAGFFLMFAFWCQLAWLAGALALVGDRVDWRALWAELKKDNLARVAAAFLGWMLLRSIFGVRQITWGVLGEAAMGVIGVPWLVVFAAVVWQAAVNLRGLAAVGGLVSKAAALAVVVSAVLFYGFMPGYLAGGRLNNCFVYGGLNAVCTGLTLGFAAVWVCGMKVMQDEPAGVAIQTAVQVILQFGVLLSRSRGALMALLAGYAVVTVVRGWRKCWREWLTLGVVVFCYQVAAPHWIKFEQAAPESPASSAQGVLRVLGSEPSPMNELVSRADSGRMTIYLAGVGTLRDVKSWLFGHGEWGNAELWRAQLDYRPDHLHSAPLATLVYGGLIGLALLLTFLALGLYRAWLLAWSGRPIWLSLLVYGLAGTLFDGEGYNRMDTSPAFEPLLVYFPLIAAASGWIHRSEERPPEQPELTDAPAR